MGGAAQYPTASLETDIHVSEQCPTVVKYDAGVRPGVESSCSKVLLNLAESASLSVKWV